jgi:membrane-bound metal-dependent hydrolase YbcI (DUF457 family)
MFNLAATVVPLVMLRRLAGLGMSAEDLLLAFAGIYVAIRFGGRAVFKRFTVHRGMFHSVPAMLIAGLLVYLGYQHPNPAVRGYLAFGAMLGFLSHLVLDEVCAVDFRGVVPKLNQFAGTALKLKSPSWAANVVTYALLGWLGYAAYGQPGREPASAPPPAETARMLHHERQEVHFPERAGRRRDRAAPRRLDAPTASIPPRQQ